MCDYMGQTAANRTVWLVSSTVCIARGPMAPKHCIQCKLAALIKIAQNFLIVFSEECQSWKKAK